MIVCSCNNLNHTKILEAKAAGAKSPCAAYRHFGCKIQCGMCCEVANALLKG